MERIARPIIGPIFVNLKTARMILKIAVGYTVPSLEILKPGTVQYMAIIIPVKGRSLIVLTMPDTAIR